MDKQNNNSYTGYSRSSSSYSIKMRTLSTLLALLMCLTVLSGCGKDKDSTTTTAKATASSVTSKDASKNTSTSKEDASSTTTKADAKSTTTTTKKGTTTTKAPAKSGSTASTTAKAVALPQPSGSSGGAVSAPSVVDQATTPQALANVDPETAASESYGAEVTIQQASYGSLNPADYTPVAYADYATHIHNCWNNFTTVDNVKIEAAHVNEYLNYVVFPVRHTFGEINCHGYDCLAASNPAEPDYVFLSVQWIYYINNAQYQTCKSKAQALCNSVSGTTVERIRKIHDLIGKNNTYQPNADGAYNCLVNNTSDCDGYTAAFKICMDILGVPCKAYMTDNHIFNVVEISGKWYVVDVTWDDQTNQGIVIAKYFLVGLGEYSQYPLLVSLPLSSSDYSCSRKICVTDETKFLNAIHQPAGSTYTLYDDGRVYCNGVTYTLTDNN